MAAKKTKDLRGGLKALLDGADKTSEAKDAIEVAEPQHQGKEELSTEELLNTLEDSSLRDVIRERQTKAGRPRKGEDSRYERATLLVDKIKMAKVRKIAALESLLLKDIIEAGLDIVIAKYEETHGTIEPLIQKKGDILNLFRKPE